MSDLRTAWDVALLCACIFACSGEKGGGDDARDGKEELSARGDAGRTYDLYEDTQGDESRAADEPRVPGDCDGKQCGDDGAGGGCGTCGGDLVCLDFQCVAKPCVPDCDAKECGDDGCNGSCGSCGANASCQEGTCTCLHKECGGKCCGMIDVCSSEDGTESCCTPDCEYKFCGPDDCGGECGTCQPLSDCNVATGQCVCQFVLCEGSCCQEGEICADVGGVKYCSPPAE